VHLRFPTEHWHRIRHSNLIERTFGETRRRTKVIGRLPGEASYLSLVWAVLGRASRGWRGLTMTPKALRLLQDLRRQLLHPTAAEGVIDEACHGRRIASPRGLRPEPFTPFPGRHLSGLLSDQVQ
jgi:Transposase, Mutator family